MLILCNFTDNQLILADYDQWHVPEITKRGSRLATMEWKHRLQYGV